MHPPEPELNPQAKYSSHLAVVIEDELEIADLTEDISQAIPGIGSGSYATVTKGFLRRSDLCQWVALKTIRTDEDVAMVQNILTYTIVTGPNSFPLLYSASNK